MTTLSTGDKPHPYDLIGTAAVLRTTPLEANGRPLHHKAVTVLGFTTHITLSRPEDNCLRLSVFMHFTRTTSEHFFDEASSDSAVRAAELLASMGPHLALEAWAQGPCGSAWGYLLAPRMRQHPNDAKIEIGYRGVTLPFRLCGDSRWGVGAHPVLQSLDSAPRRLTQPVNVYAKCMVATTYAAPPTFPHPAARNPLTPRAI